MTNSAKTKHAILLPEDNWNHSEKCKRTVPEFEFSESFEKEITDLLKTDPASVMYMLQQEGYDPVIAKCWVVHHHPDYLRAQERTPCPWCGKPLRTDAAKQCRFCGRDWH